MHEVCFIQYCTTLACQKDCTKYLNSVTLTRRQSGHVIPIVYAARLVLFQLFYVYICMYHTFF